MLPLGSERSPHFKSLGIEAGEAKSFNCRQANAQRSAGARSPAHYLSDDRMTG